MRNEELLEHADDDKAKKFKNRLEEFEEKKEEISGGADYEEAVELLRRMESTVDQVDEILTTLQEDVSSQEDRVDDIEDQFSPSNEDIDGLDELERIAVGGYHFSIKEIKQKYKDLHERLDKRINEWKSYQQEILDLKVEVLRKVADDLHGDQISKEAYDSVMEFNEKREEEFRELIEERLDDAKQIANNKVEKKISREMSEHRERVTRVEIKEEVLEEKIDDTSELLKRVISVLDNVTEQGSEEVAEVREQAEDLQQEVENPVEHAQDRIEEKVSQSQDQSSTAEVVDQEDQEKDDDSPKYEFQGRALSEMKEEFERVAENEDPEDHTFMAIAEKSDVSHNALSRKIRDVREEWPDEDIIPNLGKTGKSGN